MKKPAGVKKRVGRERGDTIVEVLLALGVLGAVLGAGYVVTNRSIITNRVAQERLDAVKLAESQFERLKVESAKDVTILGRNNFCLPKSPTPGNPTASAASAACHVNANEDPVPGDFVPRYSIVLTNVQSVGIPGNPNAGARFRVTITWDNVAGRGTDKLEQYYEVYR